VDQLIVLLTGLPILLISAAALWLLRRRGPAATIETSAAGTMTVPVKELMVRGGFPFFGMTRNSLRPKLSIERDGIRFRVLKESYWPFSELERIDARKSLFGATLVFANGAQRNTLTASVQDMEIARQVLAALPPGLPLAASAASLRG
jgi:hypothetical protein